MNGEAQEGVESKKTGRRRKRRGRKEFFLSEKTTNDEYKVYRDH